MPLAISITRNSSPFWRAPYRLGAMKQLDDPNETGQQKVIRGKLICFFSGLMTGQDVAFDREECGQTLSYIGWPTVDGSNGTDIMVDASCWN